VINYTNQQQSFQQPKFLGQKIGCPSDYTKICDRL